MLTHEDATRLIRDLLDLLNQKQMRDVADELETMMNQPVLDQKEPEEKRGKDLSHLHERPPSPIEKFRVAVRFLRARLVETPALSTKLAESFSRQRGEIEWRIDEGGEKDAGFVLESLGLEPATERSIRSHLLVLEAAAGLPAVPERMEGES